MTDSAQKLTACDKEASSSSTRNNGTDSLLLPFLDTTYAPDVQPDYGGNIFEHQHGRLRQLLVYDTEGNLVPTYDMWKHLRPGTLVTLNADLVCWVYNDEAKHHKVCCRSLRNNSNVSRSTNCRCTWSESALNPLMRQQNLKLGTTPTLTVMTTCWALLMNLLLQALGEKGKERGEHMKTLCCPILT